MLVCATGQAACGDAGGSGDADSSTGGPGTTGTGTGTDPSDPTAAPTTAPAPDTSDSLEPTTAGSGPTGDPTTTTATGDTTSDTGPDDPLCPLMDPDGLEVLTLAPVLFADGADPSGTEACAVINPERGFHGFSNLRTLDAGTLADAAADGLSLVYGQTLIPEYRDMPLDPAVLAEISAGFAAARANGFKVVPRFHYSNDGDEPDASLERILGHIEQLAPVLADNADVILTLQAGFIGAWGEWHSSQNGLDAPGPRKQILDALLAALPEHRTVTVRRPSFKQDAYAGPLTADTAFDGSPLARVGHVNDCFLASDSDMGTYEVPGEKDYAIADSVFVPVGGETCAINPPRSECPAALAELALHHWTHLNIAYHEGVLDAWKTDGCFEQIACRLGYRLAVRELRWPATAAPGATVPVSVQIFNDGFAAPVNARPMIVVFDGAARFEVTAQAVDVRRWQAGADTTACIDAKLPANLPPGDYRIGLRFPDAAPALADDPRQAIRLVNGAWDPAEGINWFDATIAVQ